MRFRRHTPEVRAQVLVTERLVDHIPDGIDLAFHVGPMRDSSLVARRVLTYRHQLVASPVYLASIDPPRRPQDLLHHRILAFSQWQPTHRWTFTHVNGEESETVSFLPHLGINDLVGVTSGLLAGQGVGDLPPIVQPELMRDRRLIEIMPDWHFPTFDLSIVHLGSRHLPLVLRSSKTTPVFSCRRSFRTCRSKQKGRHSARSPDPICKGEDLKAFSSMRTKDKTLADREDARKRDPRRQSLTRKQIGPVAP